MKIQTVGMLMGIYNEAGRIEECLRYHMQYVDEIVVVIQKSEDGTEAIVEKVKAEATIPFQILYFPKMGFSEATLQDGVNVMSTDWILYVDADEKFPRGFLEEMHKIISENKYDGYRFERENWFKVPVFNQAVPIEPKELIVRHPARDQQVRLTRRSISIFPRQIHVRARVRGKDGQENIFTVNDSIFHMKHLDEQWNDNTSYLPETKLVDAMEMTKHGELIEFPSVQTQGVLTFAETSKQIPFPVKRVFWVSGVKNGQIRGNHANRSVNEVIVPIQGSVRVRLITSKDASEFFLKDSSKGLYIKKMTWVNLIDFSEDCILLCFASEYYNEDDYIRDFIQWDAEVHK